jgi:hypothetical protein
MIAIDLHRSFPRRRKTIDGGRLVGSRLAGGRSGIAAVRAAAAAPRNKQQ